MAIILWGKASRQLLLVILAATTYANTQTAASCNVADVQTAINAANNGDTVIIPTGSCTWATGITVTKQITLQGATVPTRSATATDGTTITDGAGSAILLSLTIGPNYNTTLANLRFLPGSATGAYVQMGGTGLVPLMHDVYFNLPNFQLSHAVLWAVTGGVIWNTTFDSTYNLTGACGTQVGSDSGSIVVKSNLSWDSASTMGTLDTTGTNNLYIEDSIFSYVGQAPDVDDNGRVVIRHSQFINTSGGLTHGTTSTYGGRFVEIYNNTFSYTNTNRNANRYFWFRAGTAVITANSFQALSGACYGNKNSITFTVENAQADAAHGCCTGYMCFHQPGSGSTGTTQSPSRIGSGNPAQTPGDNYQTSDPVYIWNNTGTGQGSSHYGLNEGTTGTACNNTNPATSNLYQTSDFYVAGRDYFYDDSSSPTNGAKPGWAPYTYPHPLRQGIGSGSPTLPAPPTNPQMTMN